MDTYVNLEKIGEGTYGIVYRAVDKHNQVVALKQIRLDTPARGVPACTIREIALLKQLHHPNIIKLINVVHNQQQISLIFEHMDLDLKALLESHAGGLCLNLTRRYMLQILRGLEYCHSQKILHRDLKPQNLLIRRGGELKIADFGLARTFGIPVRAYTNDVVTLWYRPPDLLMGNRIYGSALDMWSVGCIFAEMLSGKELFRGGGDIEQLNIIFKTIGTAEFNSWEGISELPVWPTIASSIRHVQGTNLRELIPKLNDHADDLLRKMLRYDPTRRITAVEALMHPFFTSELDSM